MSDTVVDSSVVAKWILPEPDSAQAQRLITDVALKGERLIILDLVFPEVANAIWKRFHRGLATLDETNQFLDDPLRIPVHIEPAVRLLKPAHGDRRKIRPRRIRRIVRRTRPRPELVGRHGGRSALQRGACLLTANHTAAKLVTVGGRTRRQSIDRDSKVHCEAIHRPL
jgi:hypothetical protein